jgi:hypothetical protein
VGDGFEGRAKEMTAKSWRSVRGRRSRAKAEVRRSTAIHSGQMGDGPPRKWSLGWKEWMDGWKDGWNGSRVTGYGYFGYTIAPAFILLEILMDVNINTFARLGGCLRVGSVAKMGHNGRKGTNSRNSEGRACVGQPPVTRNPEEIRFCVLDSVRGPSGTVKP